MADLMAAGSWKLEPSYKTDQWSLLSSGAISFMLSLSMRFCRIVLHFGTDEWPAVLQNLWCSGFN